MKGKFDMTNNDIVLLLFYKIILIPYFYKESRQNLCK